MNEKVEEVKEVKEKKVDNQFTDKKAILVLLGLSVIFYVFVFLNDGLVDDGAFHIGRIKGLAADLSLKNIKPWIYSKVYFGVGYPLGIFYPDVFLYPFAVLVKLGLSLYASYMLMLILMNFFTGMSAYYCMKKILKYEKIENPDYKAFVIALMYFIYPYRIWDVFFRMAVGESMAFVFIPLIVLGVYEIFKQNKLGVCLFFGITGLIYSHILSVVIVAVVLVVYYLLNVKEIIKNPKILVHTLLNAVFTVFSTLMVTLPILEMQSFTKLYYQTGVKTFGWVKTHVFAFRVGNMVSIVATVLISALCIYFAGKVGIKGKLGIVLGYSIFLCTGLFVWGPLEQAFSFVNIIQFPMRMLVIGGMPFAVLVGLATFDKKPIYISTIGMLWLGTIFLCVMAYIPIDNVDLFAEYSAGRGEYMTAPEEEFFLGKHSVDEIKTEYGISRKGNTFTFDDSKNSDHNIYVLPIGYYKGYEIKDSKNNNYNYRISENGFIEVDKKDDNIITVKYVGTMIQKVSMIFSILSFVSIIIVIIIRKKD
ncbi:hypothetical protein [Eubacterium sp.]|uniref:hypothetical protein n=1 Tax=Eubacterium sp. TaxID=142586 RepID=UPI0025F88A09|nr:hypothetical protein [Eubacterium sp.]MCR5628081.1 hypothetical protein [Eubacterium sp.]